jgi:hypothetical protein
VAIILAIGMDAWWTARRVASGRIGREETEVSALVEPAGAVMTSALAEPEPEPAGAQPEPAPEPDPRPEAGPAPTEAGPVHHRRTRTYPWTGRPWVKWKTGVPAWSPAKAALILAVAVLPLIPNSIGSAPTVAPKLFQSRASADIIPQGSLVLTYPIDKEPYDAPMLWQSLTGMRFRIFGGEATVPDVDRGDSATGRSTAPLPHPLAYFLNRGNGPNRYKPPSVRNEIIHDIRHICQRYAVDVVAVDMKSPHADPVAYTFTKAFHTRPIVVGQVSLWLGVQADLVKVHTINRQRRQKRQTDQ